MPTDIGKELRLDLVELAQTLEQALELPVLAGDLLLGALLLGDVAPLGEQHHDLARAVPDRHERIVDDDRVLAGRVAEDLHVVAHELARGRAADAVANALLDGLGDLPPTRLPEGQAERLLEVDARALERVAVRVDQGAGRIEQTDELVHFVEKDSREFCAVQL